MTPRNVDDLIQRADLVAGVAPSGQPWYEPDAGAIVPELVEVIRALQRENDVLRQACIIAGTERDQFRQLLRVNESVLTDLVNLISRAGVQLDAMGEALGTRQAIHERDTVPPVSGEIARAG